MQFSQCPDLFRTCKILFHVDDPTLRVHASRKFRGSGRSARLNLHTLRKHLGQRVMRTRGSRPLFFNSAGAAERSAKTQKRVDEVLSIVSRKNARLGSSKTTGAQSPAMNGEINDKYEPLNNLPHWPWQWPWLSLRWEPRRKRCDVFPTSANYGAPPSVFRSLHGNSRARPRWKYFHTAPSSGSSGVSQGFQASRPRAHIESFITSTAQPYGQSSAKRTRP